MRKLYVLICVVLALVLGALPAAAQDTTFGLDAEDFTAFVNANDDSLEQTQYSFDYAVDFNLAGTDVPAITVALTGSGALDIDNEQISLSVDGTADFAGQSTPLSAELLVIGETLYAQAVDPASGEATGWFSFDLEELSSGADTDAAGDFFLENFAEGAEVDPADFDQEALFSAFASLASVDPESFISISRAENTFTTELSASDLLRDPNFSDALVQLLVASAIEPEADDELLTGATLVTDQLAAALEGSTFSLAQQIDPDTQLVQQSTLTLDASVDLAAIEAGTGTVDFSFVTDVTLSDYGQPAGLIVPESVTPIPSSIILDAFGVAATEDSQPEALPTASASDETTTEVTTEAGSIGVGETVTVTVPQGGVSQLSIESSETVTITARALGDADTTLTLLDANGVQIAFNDDNGGGFPNLDSLDSAIQRVSLPGSATIEVGEFGSDGGQVEVSVTAAEEIENPSSIGVGETTTVTIPSGGNALFDLETDETVTITVRSLGEADPTLTLLDGSGSEIGYNDDFSGDFPELSSLDSAISRVSIPGSATIQVGEFGDDGGQVEVSVMAAEPIENPSSIGVGEITTVTIPSGGTVPLTLETDGAVTITLRALGGADTTLTVLGPDGAEIAYNDDNSGDFPDLGTFDSAVSNVKIPGSATIEVGEYGDGGGDVEVTVTASGSVSVAPSDAQAVELTCGTAPQEFEGDVGTTFTGTCPSGCGDSSVWGTGDYTDDSGVCTAAIHAGAVGTGGGSVTFTITPGLEEYTGSTQNGITTSDWGSWGRSFSFDG